MQHDHTTRPGAVPIRNGVVALSGYGIKVSIDRRHLLVEDGVGTQRREARFAKAPSRLKRLVVIAQTGFVTLDALRWFNDAKAAFIQLDYDASILTASIGGLDDARLRRAQALIPSTEHSTAIAKELLIAKIRNQAAVLDSFGFTASTTLAKTAIVAETAKTLDRILRAEAQAAEAYWDAWRATPMQFARRDRVPDHWRTFGMRRSPLTLATRNAVNPINALLNYLYTLLEVETRVELIARGLDPGLGLFHTDTANRQSLAADVMEPVRPHVDAYVLNLVRTRTFSARDFCETRDGACRLSSTLSHELAATMPAWGKLVDPYAEMLARQVGRLAKAGFGSVRPPIAAAERARVKVRTKPIQHPRLPKAEASVPISALYNACKHCGARVTVRKRVYCDACAPLQMAKQCRAIGPTFRAAGQAKVRAMRAIGNDPSNSVEAQRRRRLTASKQRRATVAWHDDGSLDQVDFRRDILPGLQRRSIRELAEAMGTTGSHASKVRLGRLVPHKRHWKTLLGLK